MGVNVIVIVENSRGITPEAFEAALKQDFWGRRGWNWEATHDGERIPAWSAFEWNGKSYFTWLFPPRIRRLAIYEDASDRLDPKNEEQITFLKILLAVERIAGGPIHTGVDTVHLTQPESQHKDWKFELPTTLDYLIPNWREAEAIKVEKPYLTF